MILTIPLCFSLFLSLISAAWAQEGPNRPEPKPLSLDSKSTAVLVLDLHARCHDPNQICSKLLPGVGEFLEKARASAVPVIYSVSLSVKGTKSRLP